MLNCSQFKWSYLEDEQLSGKENKKQSVTQRKYLHLNVKFFTLPVVLGRPQTFLFSVNIWCLTWKILRKQWLHRFSITSIQIESKCSGQKEFNVATLIPSIVSIILACVTGNCPIKSMQQISKNLRCWQMQLLHREKYI